MLDPFRIANAYGLFAVMTEARYEIEFQGSRDGRTWIAYPFRYKPQDPTERPGIYAPYQPRFEWNLWFASLGPWQQSPWVVSAQQRLIEGSPAVLRLFRHDPFREAARAGANGALAVLVHGPGHEAKDGRVVATDRARTIHRRGGETLSPPRRNRLFGVRAGIPPGRGLLLSPRLDIGFGVRERRGKRSRTRRPGRRVLRQTPEHRRVQRR